MEWKKEKHYRKAIAGEIRCLNCFRGYFITKREKYKCKEHNLNNVKDDYTCDEAR